MKQAVYTAKGAAPKGPYSQGIVAAGRLLFVAAQGPFDPATGQVVGESFAEQATQVFRNIQAIVEAAGASMADVARVTVYFADWQYFAALNQVYTHFFPEPYPARTPVQTQLPGSLISADAVVVLPEAPASTS